MERTECLFGILDSSLYLFICLFIYSLIILFYFYWSIITLQCFVSFHWTTKWISTICIHISPSSWTSLLTLHLTHLGHDRALNWASCARQLTLIGIFYSYHPICLQCLNLSAGMKEPYLGYRHNPRSKTSIKKPYLTWVHFWLMVTQFAF